MQFIEQGVDADSIPFATRSSKQADMQDQKYLFLMTTCMYYCMSFLIYYGMFQRTLSAQQAMSWMGIVKYTMAPKVVRDTW